MPCTIKPGLCVSLAISVARAAESLGNYSHLHQSFYNSSVTRAFMPPNKTNNGTPYHGHAYVRFLKPVGTNSGQYHVTSVFTSRTAHSFHRQLFNVSNTTRIIFRLLWCCRVSGLEQVEARRFSAIHHLTASAELTMPCSGWKSPTTASLQLILRSSFWHCLLPPNAGIFQVPPQHSMSGRTLRFSWAPSSWASVTACDYR